jgi:hypothetical protein
MTTQYAFESYLDFDHMPEPKPTAEVTEKELSLLDEVLEAYFGDPELFGGESEVIGVSSVAVAVAS